MNQDHPEIGDHIWIAAHARISGNITVGENSTVSAGAILTKNVNPNNLVTGNPARDVSTAYDNRVLLRLDG